MAQAHVAINPDAIIIGAGFAGLSAGVRLARNGARVLVLEARARLGGRATTLPDRESGEPLDNGQHVLLGCYTETLQFLREIDALANVRMQAQLNVAMIDPAGRRSRLVCPFLPPPLHLLAGVLEWDALDWRDRLSALRMAGPLRLAQRAQASGGRLIAASPGETVTNWLRRHGQTPRLRELLWNPLALAALNQPADIAAAPTFVRVLAEMFGTDPGAAAIGVPIKPLHAMYAEPARTFIERRGGEVLTGAPAKLRVTRGEAISVEAAGRRWSPAIVVSALPWFAVADAIETDIPELVGMLQRASTMTASPIVTANLWFDRPLLDEAILGLPGRTMQWVFGKPLSSGNASSRLSLVSSGASTMLHMTNDEIVAAAHEEILTALPVARASRLVRASVLREPKATFSLAPGEPARPAMHTGMAGFFLAGDWIDTGLPATIESAVRSGHAAAEAACAVLRAVPASSTEVRRP